MVLAEGAERAACGWSVSRQVKTEWDDVAGLTEVKRDVELNLLGAMQRPELFTGLLQPARGILFYGPPGATPASPVGWEGS